MSGINALECEEWRPIAGLEGRYSVSSLGRVRSEPRVEFTPCYPEGRTYQGKIIAPWDNGNGYLHVGLTYPDGKRKVRVHRLVAYAFLPAEDPNCGLDVNHKNSVRSDNRAENLEWTTRSENLAHGYRRPDRKPRRYARGSTAGLAKLSEKEVLEIRAARARGESPTSLARAYGVGYANIWQIVTRCSWGHV